MSSAEGINKIATTDARVARLVALPGCDVSMAGFGRELPLPALSSGHSNVGSSPPFYVTQIWLVSLYRI